MKKVLSLLLLLTLALPLAAQRETPPPPAAPRETKIPQPVEKTLANGLRVIVVPKTTSPLVAARLLIRTGSEADPAGHAGLAEMTAELVTKGTKTKSAEQIARGVEELGATLDTDADFDLSSVGVTVLSTNLAKTMAYVADVARNPTFPKDEIDRQKQQTLDELQVALRDPRSLAQFVTPSVLFGGSPYGHTTGGTPESIGKITHADLVSFHSKYYRPNNALLVLAGDVKPEDAFALAQKLFGGWTKGEKATFAAAEKSAAKMPGPRVVVVDLPNAGQAAVTVAKRGIRRIDPTYFQALVANAVLGGGYSARLNQEVRIKRGLSYGASSNFDPRRTIGPFTAGAQTKNESAAEVAGIIVDEITRLGATDVPDTELTPRKAALIGNFATSIETSAGLARRVGTLALYGLPLSDINNYISSVEKVSAADVRAFSGKSLAANDVSVVIVGDAKKFLDPLKQRFKNVEVIPIDRLDLNSPTLTKK